MIQISHDPALDLGSGKENLSITILGHLEILDVDHISNDISYHANVKLAGRELYNACMRECPYIFRKIIQE